MIESRIFEHTLITTIPHLPLELAPLITSYVRKEPTEAQTERVCEAAHPILWTGQWDLRDMYQHTLDACATLQCADYAATLNLSTYSLHFYRPIEGTAARVQEAANIIEALFLLLPIEAIIVPPMLQWVTSNGHERPHEQVDEEISWQAVQRCTGRSISLTVVPSLAQLEHLPVGSRLEFAAEQPARQAAPSPLDDMLADFCSLELVGCEG